MLKQKSLFLVTILLMLALLISSCQTSEKVETIKKEHILNTTEEVVKEETLKEQEEVKEEVTAEPEEHETNKEEIVKEEVPTEELEPDKVTAYLKLNEPFIFKGRSIVMTRYFDGTFIEFNVDGIESKFRETRKSEIVNGLRLTYERSLYTTNGSIEVTIEEFKLGPDEYLLNKKETIEVNNHTLRLDSIKFDSRAREGVAWFSFAQETGSGFRVRKGETKKNNGLKITLIEPFWRSGKEYAHIKVE